ncbi:ISAs1 family transposase [Okeania sp.]|uniref:ISAs1 family transposase n=1 Tax=Okeania sp. TaxID=3100323 RepID=UPI002B4ADAE4|nr:ISAs1 family transposase [Okeania sp.]MEB3339927.1 ISAs1 family transposase [Okeania sp.]
MIVKTILQVKVKKNQPKLYKQIEQQTKSTQVVKRYVEQEKTRNRYTIRQVEIFNIPENIQDVWKGASSMIRVKRSSNRGSKLVESISYYLCSLSPKSTTLASGIRGHWLIENRLHWVKDVILEEDYSPQKSGFSAINFSIVKTWVLTLLRIHGWAGIKAGISDLSNNLKYILSVCT